PVLGNAALPDRRLLLLGVALLGRRHHGGDSEYGACSTRILNIGTGSNGDRPPLPRALRRNAAANGPRNTSNSTTAANRSSGSPAALGAAYRSERSKKPGCPVMPTSAPASRQRIVPRPRTLPVFRGVQAHRI